MLMSVTSDTIKSPILLDLNRLNKSIYGNKKPHNAWAASQTNHTNVTMETWPASWQDDFWKPQICWEKPYTQWPRRMFFVWGGEDSTSSALAMAPCPVVHPLVPRSKEVPFSMRQVGDGRYQNRFSVWILQTELVAWIPELSHNHGSGKLP